MAPARPRLARHRGDLVSLGTVSDWCSFARAWLLAAAMLWGLSPNLAFAQQAEIEPSEPNGASLAPVADPTPDQEALAQAQLQAIEARNEQNRLIESQLDDLTSTEAAQSELRSKLAEATSSQRAITELANTWQIKAERLAREEAASSTIDSAYDELVEALTAARADLRASLRGKSDLSVEQIRPQPINPLLDESRTEVEQLNAKYTKLQTNADALEAALAETQLSQKATHFDAVRGLNSARLTLIPDLTDEKRRRVTGFGREGVAQVGREIDQLLLEGGYYLQIGPQELRVDANLTPKLVFEVMWIALASLVFRFWRVRGDGFLVQARRREIAQKSGSARSALKIRWLAIWRGIRRPLDWTVFLLLLRWLWPAEHYYSGVAIVWLVLFWTSCTFLLLRFINEIAKGTSKSDPRAELRWRSLRAVGFVLLAIILALQVLAQVVGRGTVFSWVAGLTWIAVPVLLTIITVWWHERIRALAETEAERSGFLAWIAQRPFGVTTLLPYMLAGANLLTKSVRSTISREVSRFALVRELGRQKERDEASKKVAENKASGMYRALPHDKALFLFPHRTPTIKADNRFWPKGFSIPKLRPGTITAVIGDRGLGKSTLMRDTADAAEEFDQKIYLTVDARGLSGVLDDLTSDLQLKCDSTDIDAIADSIKVLPLRLLIAIDDLHRLIVPAINGLIEFDQLTRLARGIGPQSVVVTTIEHTSWDFLERARQDRLVFDSVIKMPRWSLDEVRDLIERRTSEAGIEADFAKVIDSGAFAIEEDLSPEERKKFQYFRRLHDYTDGNPAIALEYWRRSLFVVAETGKVVALTFERPNAEELSNLPTPALLVMRVILQMGRAQVSALERSTHLPSPTISGILRRLERLGAVTTEEGCYLIALDWWLEVRRLLERRNLVVRRDE